MSGQHKRGNWRGTSGFTTRAFRPTGKREKPFVPDVRPIWDPPTCLCDHSEKVHVVSDRWFKGNEPARICSVPGCGCLALRTKGVAP